MEGARQRRLQKQKSRCTLSSLQKTVSRNKRRRLKFTPLQSHFHRGFKKQIRNNNFLILRNFQKNINKYSLCRGNQPNAKLCKISEGDTEQEEEDC